jgi:hypothetical protein
VKQSLVHIIMYWLKFQTAVIILYQTERITRVELSASNIHEKGVSVICHRSLDSDTVMDVKKNTVCFAQ